MTVLLILILFMLLFVLLPTVYLVLDDFLCSAFPDSPNLTLFLFIAAFVIVVLIHLSDWYEERSENKMTSSNKQEDNEGGK